MEVLNKLYPMSGNAEVAATSHNGKQKLHQFLSFPAG